MKYNIITFTVLAVLLISTDGYCQNDTIAAREYPVVVESDTLFYISQGIGIFSAEQRAIEISALLTGLVRNDTLIFDSIAAVSKDGIVMLQLNGMPIMAITKADIVSSGISDSALTQNYMLLIKNKLNEIRDIYTERSLITRGIYSLVYLILLIAYFWLLSVMFPRINNKLEKLESERLKNIRIRDKEIITRSTINKILLVLFRGFTFALSLFAIYLFITKTLELWPYTRNWDLQPIIKSAVLFVFYSVLFYAIIKGLNSIIKLNISKYDQWKGTRIKSIKIKTIEILPVERLIGFLKFLTKAAHLTVSVLLFYVYLTIVFSLFRFSETWARTLLDYVLNPVRTVWINVLNFLPNLFFIIVLVIIFRYLIKAVKFFFMEIDKGTLTFPGFHAEWAIPTFKISRFMIIVLAAVVIFPYLPGSSSPFFQGISVFLGILFSLGSSSAIANIVSGIVITYMRPFKLGDRVKIADTMGDVIEKTLLVTRVRTIKNVDITIPNAMVLGSHIINYSSSAKEKGLILHTTITIGYDVPWQKVQQLLISAAGKTEHILKEPGPFVLQTSLNDFYISYELNAYTNNSQSMAIIYSQLHSNIHDVFNEAGVEIMSPHYSALRDGNKVTIPEDYLPNKDNVKHTSIIGNLFGSKPGEKNSSAPSDVK